MRSELTFAGLSLNMGSRRRRRILVVVVYMILAAMLTASLLWAPGTLESALWIVLVIPLINRLVFGGLTTRGLVRPFFPGIRPLWLRDDPPPASSIDRWFWRRSSSRKDLQAYERDDRRRDRAHFHSYRILSFFTYVVWGLFAMVRMSPLFGAVRVPFDFALLAALAVAMLAFTLPQAILLWTEPDMEE